MRRSLFFSARSIEYIALIADMVEELRSFLFLLVLWYSTKVTDPLKEDHLG